MPSGGAEVRREQLISWLEALTQRRGVYQDRTLVELMGELDAVAQAKLSGDVAAWSPFWTKCLESFDAFVLVVSAAGQICFINRLVPPYSWHEVVGQSVFDFLGAADVDRSRVHMEQVLRTGEGTEYDVDSVGPDGTRAVYRTRVERISCPDGNLALLYISRDITSNARLQAERDRSVRRFEALFGSEVVGVLVCDASGRIRRANRGFSALTGLAESEVSGVSISDVFHPDDRPAVDAFVALGGEQSAESAARTFRLDARFGGGRTVALASAPLYERAELGYESVITVHDLTALQKAHDEHREIRRQMDLVFDRAETGMLVLDERGVIERYNRRFARQIEAPDDRDLTFARFDDLVEMVSGEDVSKVLVSSLRGGVLRVRGHERWLDASVSLIERRSGKPKVLAVLRDVTDERAQRAREQRHLEELASVQAEERRRIAQELHDEVGQLTTSLAVELRLLAKAAGQHPMAEDLADAAVRTEALTREVSRISRGLYPVALEERGLLEVVERHVMERTSAANLRLDLVLPSADELVDVSRPVALAVYRTIQEGVTNVIKHAGATRLGVMIHRHGRSLKLIVEDDGTGVSREAHLRGFGYGLGTMRERVARLGGVMTVESTPEQGTALHVSIPVAGA